MTGSAFFSGRYARIVIPCLRLLRCPLGVCREEPIAIAPLKVKKDADYVLFAIDVVNAARWSLARDPLVRNMAPLRTAQIALAFPTVLKPFFLVKRGQ